jgi:hypothetical protein
MAAAISAPRCAGCSDVKRLRLDAAESMRIAFQALSANKGRGALTTLGIIIGIVAVGHDDDRGERLQNRSARASPRSAPTSSTCRACRGS